MFLRLLVLQLEKEPFDSSLSPFSISLELILSLVKFIVVKDDVSTLFFFSFFSPIRAVRFKLFSVTMKHTV